MFAAPRRKGTNLLCAVGSFVLGIGAIAWGIYWLSESGEHKREKKVAVYDQAVDYWTAHARAQFTGLKCSVKALLGGGSFALEEDTSLDKLRDSTTSDLHVYSPLKYSHNGTIAPGLEWDAVAQTWGAPLNITCSGGAATKESSLVTSSVPMYFTKVYQSANQKQCQYQKKGSYVDGGCQVYQVAQTLCVKISLYDGAWNFNSTYGGYGCHGNALGWPVGFYKYQRGSMMAFGHGKPPVGEVDLSSLVVQVRSGLDPWIDAEYLTDDTQDFGASEGQEVTGGIVLLVFGCALMSPAAYVYYESRKRTEDRRVGLSAQMDSMADEEDDFDNPLSREATALARMDDAAEDGGERMDTTHVQVRMS